MESEHTLIDVVAAGHICLDIIPTLQADQGRPETLILPGRLTQIGPATVSLGGSVANTGLALHRLGARTRLVGKVGDDLLGRLLLDVLREQGESLCRDAVIAAGEATSYTIVISPPGVDRAFLHCPGTNDTFSSADLAIGRITPCRILHFGYPPLMKGILLDEGAGLADKFAAVQAAGGLVSLDMAAPDPRLGFATVQWRKWLDTVLPHVDLFAPSLDEVLLMLDPATHAKLCGANAENVARAADGALLDRLANELLSAGARIVALKLGDQGLYLRSQCDLGPLRQRAQWQRSDWSSWQNRELWTPCFRTEVAGTTGAGDCTIAGLLMALLEGLTCESALRHAVAVGAWSVQSPDATGSVPSWTDVQASLRRPWPPLEPTIALTDWEYDEATKVYRGSKDRVTL